VIGERVCVVDDVVERQQGQQVDDEQTSDILPRDDTELVVCEPAIVDVGDEKARDDIEDHDEITDEACRQQRVGHGVEGHRQKCDDAVHTDGDGNDHLPDVAHSAAKRYDTIEEFNVDSKAECDQLNLAHVEWNHNVGM